MDMTLKLKVSDKEPREINLLMPRIHEFEDAVSQILGNNDEYEIVECCAGLKEMLQLVPLSPDEQIQTIRLALQNMKSYGAAPIWMFVGYLVKLGFKLTWDDVAYISGRGYSSFRTEREYLADYGAIDFRNMGGVISTHITNRIPIAELVHVQAASSGQVVINIDRPITRLEGMTSWVLETQEFSNPSVKNNRWFFFQSWNEGIDPRN